MRLGICSWAFDGIMRGRRTAGDLTRAASAAGFQSIEGAYARRGPLSADQEPHGDQAVPIASLATLELHRFPLVAADPVHRRHALGIVAEMIRCADRWSIPTVSFSPGALPDGPGGPDIGETLDMLARDLVPLVRQAADRGIGLALENLPGHVLAQRSTMAELLDRLPEAGLCLDVGNALADPPVEQWFDRFAARIVKFHLSDGHTADGRLVPVELGRGDVDWTVVAPRIRATDLDAFIEPPLDPSAPGEAERLPSLKAAADEVLGLART
ncbi:MAG TPA: sugar phosphate isomerase/epimerase family protein [Arenibaculum sp.]|nr:sugar phosphate isomerase/epimerase family protein [Arenibaculum sp.]